MINEFKELTEGMTKKEIIRDIGSTVLCFVLMVAVAYIMALI